MHRDDCPHPVQTRELANAELPFRWLLVSSRDHADLDSQRGAEGLLSEREQSTMACLRFARRRHKWLLGRLAAKELIRSVLRELKGVEVPPAALFIGNEASGAPYAEFAGEKMAWPISISHRTEWGVAGIAFPPVRALGIDVETVESRSDSWFHDFFVDEEIAEVARASPGHERNVAVARIWSAKESVLKALGLGLRLDTRSIRVCTPRATADSDRGRCCVGADSDERRGWMPLDISVSHASLGENAHGVGDVRGYWHLGAGFVLSAAIFMPE